MCQTFVENIIDINDLMSNIVDQATLNALKPIDAKALISTLGSRSNIVKVVTDLGAKLDKLIFDRKIKWKKSQLKEFVPLHNNDTIYNAIFELEKHGKHKNNNKLDYLCVLLLFVARWAFDLSPPPPPYETSSDTIC